MVTFDRRKQPLLISNYLQNEYRLIKEMVARFFEIDDRTIQRYLEQFEDELKHNGCILIKGKTLKEFKLQFGHVINVQTKTAVLQSCSKDEKRGLIF